MRYLFSMMVMLLPVFAAAQGNFPTKKVQKKLKQHVYFLADDKLEGRRTGTAGEKLAADYISRHFAKNGLKPYWGDSYIQPFNVNDGREIEAGAAMVVDNNALTLHDDYFPLSYSGSGYVDAKLGSDKIFVLDLGSVLRDAHANPSFDMEKHILTAVDDAEKRKAFALLVVNTSSFPDGLSFEPRSHTAPVSIPVVYVKKASYQKFLENKTPVVKLKIGVLQKSRTGHNVAAFIDNGAPYTIVLGAHYDHLGYGEDRNSLYVGDTPQIHNGADDNASGTAGMLELGRLLKKRGNKANNYLLVAFSGEELGLFGSKYFVESLSDHRSINYMINMDMLGRLNDSTRGLTVGGFGTSPFWPEVIKPEEKGYFKIKIDSSGSGPSDHTSFYRKDIPVLFFFTGTHSDYHKPSDDADKINFSGQTEIVKLIYHIVQQSGNRGKLAIQKTREPQMGRTSFKVTLGIMPDYTYSGKGVLVDGISDNRPAQKAGILAGDVIVQMGDHKVTDVMTYMKALNKFEKGESTKVKLKRGNEEIEVTVTF